MLKNSSKSKFAKITAKAIVLLMAVVFCFSALPALSADVIPLVSAATEYVVPQGATVADINSKLETYSAGSEVNMILSDNITFESVADNTVYEGIVIPQNITVNLYMNGKAINYSQSSWKLKSVTAITNKGNLNVFSGSGPSSPNISQVSETAAAINMLNNKVQMYVEDDRECAYSYLEGIRNAGNLTVNKNVTIKVHSYLKYRDEDGGGQGQVANGVTGIYNSNIGATSVIKGAVIDVNSDGCGVFNHTRRAHTHTIAYGVYGGNVSASAGATINIKSLARCTRNHSNITSTENDGTGRLYSTGYGIAANGSVSVTGADINYEAKIDATNSCENKDNEGQQHLYAGGIFVTTGISPYIPDANIYGAESSKISYTSKGTKIYNLSSVCKSASLPKFGGDVIADLSNSFDNGYSSAPTDSVTVGSFTDEVGNVYPASISTTLNALPLNMNYGAIEGKQRVHIIYRYWLDSSRTNIDTSIVGANGNVGYSFTPLVDGTDIVDTSVELSGLTSTSNLTKNQDSGISYVSGANPCNSYYWGLHCLTSTIPSNNVRFSDINFTSSSNRGRIFRSFSAQGATNEECGVGNPGPIYIFVDYIKIAPSSIRASVGSNNAATTTYTGRPIKASAIGLSIFDSISGTNFTNEYNVDFNNSNLINISFAYTGTNAAGVEESSVSGNLPTNAGTYEVTLRIDESTVYSKNPVINKNRYALNYSFTLVIEQASVGRGNLPGDVALTYGQRLADVLTFNDYNCTFLANDSGLSGVYSFANAIDGTSYKSVGTGTVSVVWTPAYSSSATAKNYKATAFNVLYSVAKAPLVISPNGASVVYGNENFDTPYNVTITGLVGNDNNQNVKSAILNALQFHLLKDSSYIPYVAGETAVGNYDLRASFVTVPEVLSNYQYECVYGHEANPSGVLRVTKRPIMVEATAVDREYAADNYNVYVSFEITSGRFGADDVRITSAQGGLANNSAGTREVGGVTNQLASAHLAGGSASNYVISELTFSTGAKLLVNISKAVPTVTAPVVSEMYYQRLRTLGDITLSGSTSNVAGTWRWVNDSINPTVSVSHYSAEFVPLDSVNYETKTVSVSINIKPTPVLISYEGTVSYGDNIPNITAYKYTSNFDPNFDINSVTTSGNITPYTTYVKGSPVISSGYPVEIVAPNYVDVNGNYLFSTENGVINVTPREINFTIQDKSIEYGENYTPSASTVTMTYDSSRLVGTDTIEAVTSNGTEPVFEYSTDFRYIDNYSVGTYYIRASVAFTSSPNYRVTVTPGTLKVTKAPLVIKADNRTLSYNSEIPSDIATAFTVVGAKRNETINRIVSSGSIYVDTTYEKGVPVNSAGYPITIDITDATFDNYTVSVEHGKITVIKANPRVTSLPTASIIYGQSLAEAVFTGGLIEDGVAGTYVYDSANTVPPYRTAPYTNYTVTFVPSDSVNYNTVTGLNVSLTVNKKPVSGSLAVNGIPMVGETLAVDVSGLNPSEIGIYTVTWYDETDMPIAIGTEFTLTSAVGLQRLTVKAVANAPYTGEIIYVTTTISPELTSIETILTNADYATYFNLTGLSNFKGEASYVYNAQPHNVVFGRNASSLSTAAIGDITVKYNGSTQAPTSVGYYTVTIDVATPEDVDFSQLRIVNGKTMVGNKVVYSPIANYTIGTLIITKAPYTVNVKVLDKVYDGTNSATATVLSQTGACTLTGGAIDDVSYDESSAHYFFSSVVVGNNKIVQASDTKLIGSAAENYELVLNIANNSRANITKRTLKIKINPVEREYEPNNYYVDLSFEIVDNTIALGDDGLVYIDEALVQGSIDNYRAGIRNVTVSGAVLAGDKAGNYNLEFTNLENLKVEILKATPGYPIPMVDSLYYDSARPLSSISLGDSRWSWHPAVINDVPGAGTHTFEAIYTPDDTLNYAVVKRNVTLTILKTQVTVTAADFTLTYGEIEPTYYYTVTGLTGADTVRTAIDGYVLLNCSYSAGSDVGTYPVVLTGAFESDNYTFVYKNGQVRVNKRPVYVEAIAEDREYEPGNVNVNVTFSELTNIYASDGTSVFLEGVFPITGTVESDIAGVKTVNYTIPALAGAKAHNYVLRLNNPSLTVEIKKARINGVVLPTTGTINFGQRLSLTEFTSSFEGAEYGVFSMENPNSTPAAVGTFSDVYKVVFTPYNTTNYATVSQYITLTVNPSQLNLSLTIVGTLEVDKVLEVITSDMSTDVLNYIKFDWYIVDEPGQTPTTGILAKSDSQTYRLQSRDEGKYVVCVASQRAGSPYNVESKAVSNETVKEQKISFWQKIVNWFYRIIASFTQLFGKMK